MIRKRNDPPVRSMEETISGWMVLIGLASMLLTAVLVGVMFTRTLGNQLVQDLGRQTQTLAAALDMLATKRTQRLPKKHGNMAL